MTLSKRQIDRGTVAGVAVAITGVVAGLMLDGGSVKQILQPTAALIVMGGTLGAVLIQFPMPTVRDAVLQLRQVFLHADPLSADYIEELGNWCLRARRHGMLSIDPHLAEIEDDFLRKSLTLAVDGVVLSELRETMEVDLDLEEERGAEMVRVLEAAGGFAPTLGIIGAVLGLIQVMQRMDNVAEIGKGIAVAFVSTLYGIGIANLFFLPLAGRLRIRVRQRQLMQEMTLDAVIAMVQGISARALKRRLQSYLVAGKVVPQEQPQSEMVTQ
jgi:chemotaxis protein MotA